MKIFISFLLLVLSSPVFSSRDLETTADQIVSVFENSTTVIQYNSIIDIGDGRGYTAGKAGFTTATGDLLELLKRYLTINPQSQFSSLMPLLIKRSDDEDGNVTGLENLPKYWHLACKDENFIITQDKLVEDWYKAPARIQIKKRQFIHNLSYVIFYDSFIQHGDGKDPDSFFGILKKMSYRGKDEKEFISSFLQARLKVLHDPADHDSRDAWRESVDRVRAFQRLIKEGNWELKSPFTLKVWNESYKF